MDWTRRRFLWSTALIAAAAGCQQPGDGSNAASLGSNTTTDSPDQTTTNGTLSASPTASPTGTPTGTTTGDRSPTDAKLHPATETQTQTQTETETQSQTQTQTETETQSQTQTQTETADSPDVDTLHTGATIPQQPHAPRSTAPPTGRRFRAESATPVLRGSDVTDYGDVDYVADPFLFVEDGTWHMFFEIVNESRHDDAPIGHATSPDGLNWTYDRVVLKNRYHQSFPLTWKYRGRYYMTISYGKRVELYRARRFPTDWKYIGNAIDVGYYCHDPSFVWYRGRWWLFTERENSDVMVYHSRRLEPGEWTPHKRNPVVTDRPKAARQGGRPMVIGNRLFLYFQDGVENYGDAIRCYEVTNLSPSIYNDREMSGSPVLYEFGSGWANRGMHTFDPWWRGPGEGWRCAVDGVREQDSPEDQWTIGIVDIPP